jgi:hypothetical protein
MGDTTEDLGIVIDDSPPIVTPEPEEAAAPATPAEQQEKPAPEDPDPSKAIAKYAFEARNAKREAETLRKQLADAQKGPQPERPVIPEVANPLGVTEAEFRQQQAQREEAIRNAAIFDANQKAQQEQQAQQEAARQREQQEALIKTTQTYSSRAVQLGMKSDELERAGAVVAQFGLDDQLAGLILGDDQGPLITKYLAENLGELERINALASRNPFGAAIEIVNIIKPKAASLKPRVSNAPPPAETVGSGAMSFSQAGPAGATYE